MNLNKYTKAELISKLKTESKKIQDSKINQNSILIQIKSYFNQVWELLITFKSLLLKLTLISFIVNLFKRYSIFLKIWRFLTTIVMTIFGISLLDNFAFDLLSNFIKELKYITHNIIFYITQTQFYVYLSEIFKGHNKDIEKTAEDQSSPSRESTNISRKNTTDESWTKESQRGIKESNRDSKISEWLKPVKDNIPNEKIEDDTFYDSWKVYLITGTIIVAGCFIWVYSDEIKSTWTSFYEWIMSFRTGPGDDSGSANQNIRRHHRSDIQERLKEALKKELPSPHIELEDLSERKVELFEEKSNLIKEVKGKEVLTSPSLEDLNSKATESWNEGTSSPRSDSSDITIKPLYSSEATSSKAKLVKLEEISPNETSVKNTLIDNTLSPSDIVLEDKSSFLSIKDSWKKKLEGNTIEKIQKLEKRCSGQSLGSDGTMTYVSTETVEILGKIIKEYEIEVETYRWGIEHNKFDEQTIEKYKEASFYFREWIYKYSEIVFKGKQGKIDLGTINDAPVSIVHELLEEPLETFNDFI